MKQNELRVSPREETGRGPTRRLRTQGRIPAVIYGNSGTRVLSIDMAEFRTLWSRVVGTSTLIQVIEEGEKPKRSLIQEVQRNPMTDEFLHIDFKEIAAGVQMQTNVAVEIIGEAEGVRIEGALLEIHLHEVGVRCFPRYLPEILEIDVSEMQVGSSLHVGDLKPMENVTILDDPEKSIVSCVMPAFVEEVEEEEEEVVADEEGEGVAEGKEATEGQEAGSDSEGKS